MHSARAAVVVLLGANLTLAGSDLVHTSVLGAERRLFAYQTQPDIPRQPSRHTYLNRLSHLLYVSA